VPKTKISSFILFSALLSSCSTGPQNNQVLETRPEDIVAYVNKNARAIANLSQYKIIGDCDGYPQVDVKTAPGFCLGLVHNGEGTTTPRGITQLSENEFLISDMGPNWARHTGKLYLLNTTDKKSNLKVLLDAQSNVEMAASAKISMDRPNQITKDRNGNIYIASASSISRFHADKIGTDEMIEIVIKGIPTDGIHPLKAIAFDKENNMYVNIGSKTNVCEEFGGGLFKKPKSCPEVKTLGHAAIYKYTYSGADNSFNPKFINFAKGLRNSMVLIWDDEQNVLLQVENARDGMPARSDYDDKLFPHDEMNIISASGKHFGWPYCFDNNLANPEFKKWDCSPYQKPHLLMPPHAASLGTVYYQGDLFPEWYKKRYIFSLHGFEAQGHRLVTFKRNEKLLPTGDALSIVYDWNNRESQSMGTPVGMTEGLDGSLYIVEDKSRKVVRLFYDARKGDGKPVMEDLISSGKVTDEEVNELMEKKIALDRRLKKNNPPLFSQFQSKVIDQSCISCHGGRNAPGIQLLQYDDIGNAKRIIAAKKALPLFDRISAAPGMIPMPPQGFKGEKEKNEAIDLLKAWIDAETPIPN
jgi:glucose/arabinose dehydrogenase